MRQLEGDQSWLAKLSPSRGIQRLNNNMVLTYFIPYGVGVDEIRSVLLLFSNPAWTNVGTIPTTIVKNITALSARFSYSSRIDNITVLTSRYAKTTNGAISGFLYVPTLPADDPCVIDSAPHVPDYAVRRSDLPPTNYFLVALSPWISPECSRSYMIAARRDPVIGFIFYQTVDTNDAPPPPDSPEWDIEDGSRWMDESRFPVYAVSGLAGQHMMRNLSLYSGPMTAIPHGPNISDLYSLDPTDFVRVWTEIHVSTPSALPSLWVYALIIIGVLLVVITLTSLLMHFVQNRRRASLKRRVRAGQVNLEGMGIKRLTVPMEHIKSFPLYTYHYEPPSVSVSSPPTSPRQQQHGETPTRRGSRGGGTTNNIIARPSTTRTSTFPNSNNRPPTSPTSAMFHTATDYQPMCDICLQQYRNRLTVIRELPCGHIFHPECIDEFLNQVSSLCPLCKACMLPSGYCPPITNIMVRRERAIRRLRDRVVVEEDLEEDENNNTNNNNTRDHGPGRRFQAWRIALRNKTSSSSSSAPTTELQIRPPPPPPSAALAAIEKEVVGAADPDNNTTRRSGDDEEVVEAGSPTDLARRRMLELAGSQPDDQEPQFTRWERIRRGMFPGF